MQQYSKMFKIIVANLQQLKISFQNIDKTMEKGLKELAWRIYSRVILEMENIQKVRFILLIFFTQNLHSKAGSESTLDADLRAFPTVLKF